MGVTTSVVNWWEESQMRVLVLGSLVVQFLLLICTYLRTRAIPGWIRFLTWLSYLGGDAIAIYALATLFNRHKNEDRGGGKSMLEVVWAPILLLHLGGLDRITAYNIEDNELWTRHLLTAVSQVTVAIYVFCKSWPPAGDTRLLQTAIVLFVPGVLKCFAKPWALKRASIKSLVSSHATQADMKPLEDYVKQQAKGGADEQRQAAMASSTVEDGDNIRPIQGCRRRRRQRTIRDDALHEKQSEGAMDTLEEYVNGAMAFVARQKIDEGEAQGSRAPVEDGDHIQSQQRHDVSPSKHQLERRTQMEANLRILHGEVCKLFADLSSPYTRRLSIFKFFWVLSQEKDNGYGCMQQGLSRAFCLLYTKIKMVHISPMVIRIRLQRKRREPLLLLLKGAILQCISYSRFYLPWTAIGLFHHSHREAYNGTDVKITYALLCCTAFLEMFTFSGNWKVDFLEMFTISGSWEVEGSRGEWPEMVAQYSLIGYSARDKWHSKKMLIVSWLPFKDFLDQHWCMESCFSSRRITQLVLGYLKDGWKKGMIHDAASYHKFNDNRGQCALKGYEDELDWSIKGPFDESVLLWHIATDLCFFSRTTSRSKHGGGGSKAVDSREMSSYLVYLLFVNPEMLLPGTRRNLFRTAYGELKHILRDYKCNPRSCCQWEVERELMEEVISTMQDKSGREKSENGEEKSPEAPKEESSKGVSYENFIQDAWDLAQELLNLGDDKMWDVIHGVWVEMLCFSAGRCRGYLHAKALGSGGEFLSYVWLHLFYMGMETFTERLQREELPNWEASNNGAPWLSEAHNGSATTSSTSEVHISVSPSSENHIIGEELV